MKSRRELKKLAWEQLRPTYWMVLVALLVTFAIQPALAPIAIIISGPIAVGISIYLLDIIENKADGRKIEIVLDAFKKNLPANIIAYILIGIFTFLWSLLLIIPGIVKAISYSMTTYILAENTEINAMDAIKQSQEMMQGHKMEFFLLLLSFFWWFVLSMLTFGLGFIFLLPYIQMTITNYYIELRGKKKVQLSL
ncbi:MAG: DUF975 family protein [Bacillota bacterium]|nr:MAG: DUF975 family protein [Bacillota bacterium]